MPSLAFAECMPIAATLTTIVLYKRMGVDNDFVTYYTAWLLLPWVMRPLVQRAMPPTLHSRATLVTLEALVAVVLACVAYVLTRGAQAVVVNTLMWLVGLCGVMHSVESDRLYDKVSRRRRPRIYTVGYGAGFFLAMLLCHGLVVTLAGNMEVLTRQVRPSWQLAYNVLAATFALLALLHAFTLRQPDSRPMSPYDTRRATHHFFHRRRPWLVAAFLVLYLLPEGLCYQVASLFVIDARHNGGLGLSPAEYGLVQGTVGMVGLTVGGMLGGMLVRRRSLWPWMWAMAAAMALPSALFLFLSHDLTGSLLTVCLCVMAAQAALGFGLAGYILYLTHYNRSGIALSHYTLCASFAALPMMLPAFYAGTWQQTMGYRTFFAVALLLSLVSLVATWLLRRAEGKP